MLQEDAFSSPILFEMNKIDNASHLFFKHDLLLMCCCFVISRVDKIGNRYKSQCQIFKIAREDPVSHMGF